MTGGETGDSTGTTSINEEGTRALWDQISDLQRVEGLARAGSWRWYLSTGRVYWSQGLFSLLGVAPTVEPTPELFFECIHPEDRSRVRRLIQQALDSVPPQPVRYRVRDQHSEAIRFVRGIAEPFLGTNGQVEGYRGTLIDITEQTETEAQLRQSQKLESLGQLAAGLAHDFNNLLTVITVNVGLLRESHPAEELDEIAESSSLAAKVTGQLLGFSRQTEPVLEQLDLKDALRSIEPLARRLLKASVHVTVELPDEPCRVTADRSQLQQIVLNLAVNASDAMPRGGKLRLAVRTVERGALEYAAIVVSDTGVGMDEETKQRIFDPFFTTKEAGRGTGLGLSTVATIAKALNGHVAVESTPGHGTTFSVLLPSIGRASSELAEAITNELAIEALDGIHVAIVEGQQDVRKILERTFDDAGAWVRSFGGPEDLYRAIEEGDFVADLLVTDPYDRPLSGQEIHQRVVRTLPRCRPIFVSGYARDPEPQVSRAAGWVMKPFTRDQLLEEAVRVLRASE